MMAVFSSCVFRFLFLAPHHLFTRQSHSPSMPEQGAASPRDDSGMLLMQGTNQNTQSEHTYHPGLSVKRRRWESAGSESPLESGKDRVT